MKCPVCNGDLLMGERLIVSINCCPKCRGIWLTNDKLDRLLDKAGSGGNSHAKKDRREKDDDDEGGISGFIRGIFD